MSLQECLHAEHLQHGLLFERARLRIDLHTKVALRLDTASFYCHGNYSCPHCGRASLTISSLGPHPILNLLVLALLALPSLNVAYSIVTSSQSVHPVAAFGTNIAIHGESPKLIDSASRPDIYYIIPDGYPSDSWLQESMNYDNLNFTTELEDRGFLVAKHAQSNYSATLLSLASALNLHHYNSNPSSFADLDYLRVSIADSAVARRLQEIGYTYIQFLSGYLIPSPAADINRDFTPQGVIEIGFDQNMIPITKFIQLQTGKIRNNLELGHFYKRSFFTLYAETSALRLIVSLLNKLNFQNEVMPYDLFSPERFLAAIDEVASIASMPEATFTVVHLMKPHGPTVFDEKGEIIENIYVPSHQEYFSEFAFTNTKFLNMIDTLFELSENPPVIIFQGDHGSTYGDVWTADKRLTHFDTYAAYFLPDPFLISLPKPFTLINSFALILNELFDTEYDMQEDRLYELLDGYSGPF